MERAQTCQSKAERSKGESGNASFEGKRPDMPACQSRGVGAKALLYSVGVAALLCLSSHTSMLDKEDEDDDDAIMEVILSLL